MALTELAVKKLGKKNSRYEVQDNGGLYIRVAPTGSKTWVFRYQFDGRPRRMTLGQWPGVGIAAAREKYGQALQELQTGTDPGRKAQEAKAALKAAPTFAELVDEQWHKELKKKKSGAQILKILKANVIPVWGKWKVTDVKRRHIVILLDKIEDRAPVLRNRVQGALSRIFNFAAERGVIDDSPCTRIKKVPEKARERVLSDDEIKILWAALDLENKAVDIYAPTKLILKMILLTGQRPGEVAGMQWGEIDGETWAVPADRSKTGSKNEVPLLPMAKAVLEEARIFSGGCEHVFRSSRKEGSPINRCSVSKAIDRHFAEMGIAEKFTPHDLRRTLRTRLAELRVDDITAEKVLGHQLQGMLKIYNRHDYAKEKREALAKWEQRLSEILGHTEAHGGRVISLAERRRA